MPKGYWVTSYRSVRDPDALAAYAKLAFPALTAAGGRVLVRGMPAHDTPAYQEALRVLGNAVDRDLRIVPGA